MITTYADRPEFLAAVKEQLRSAFLSDEWRGALLDGIGQADIAADARDDASALHLRVGKWFIRSDDLPFFDLLTVTAASVAAVATSGGLAAPALVTALINLAKACWQIRRKGADLTAPQIFVLGVLQTAPALSESDISKQAVDGKAGLDASGVRAVLDGLTRVELYDGTIVALARHDQDGRWRALPQ